MIYIDELTKEGTRAVKMGLITIGKTVINTIELYDSKHDFMDDALLLRGDVESFIRREFSFGKDTIIYSLISKVYSRFLETISNKSNEKESTSTVSERV